MTLVIALLVSACGGTETGGSTSATPESPAPVGSVEELATARQRWAAARLDSYHYEFRNDCGECDPSERRPRQVVIWDGEPSGPRQHTVEALFERVEQAIVDERSVEVTYHPDLGYPTDLAIDMEARAYDGGTHWMAGDLVPGLPGESASLAELRAAQEVWKSARPISYEFLARFGCDCPVAGSIWTRVDAGRVVDWSVEFEDGTGRDPVPITVDDIFEDLADILSSDGVVDGGSRITGSAAYHPDLGYPEWIGLDIEVLDSDSSYADLAPRLVITIQDLQVINGGTWPELSGCRFPRGDLPIRLHRGRGILEQ